jgi:NAD(P)-dependent dehydrogenase (short-subunit alcohol dehydrogenase family)
MLAGKTALVTGASRGIGLAIAQALLAQGAKVGMLARSPSALQAQAAQLGPDALPLLGDVRDAANLTAAVARLEAEFGGLDILICNAGIGIFASIDQISAADFQAVVETNLYGPFHALQAAIPAFRRRGGGIVINIGSLAAKNPMAGGAAYNASKFGLLGFSQAAMLDLRSENIRVMALLPGSVDTEFSGHAAGSAWKIQPEDVAQAVLYLLSADPRVIPSELELRPTRPPH